MSDFGDSLINPSQKDIEERKEMREMIKEMRKKDDSQPWIITDEEYQNRIRLGLTVDGDTRLSVFKKRNNIHFF